MKQIQKLFLLISILLITLSVFPIHTADAQTLSVTANANPAGPVPPGTNVELQWVINGPPDRRGAPSICRESPPSKDPIALVVTTCNGESIQYSGSKTYKLDATTQFIVKSIVPNSPPVFKEIIVEVREGAPTPTPTGFVISAFEINPNQVMGGEGKTIKMTWQSSNAPSGNLLYAIKYSTVDANGQPVKGTDGQPITDKTLDLSKATCNDTRTSCEMDISVFGNVNEQGATTAGTTTFRLTGSVGSTNTPEKTATLTVGRGESVADQEDPANTGTLYTFIVNVISTIVIFLTQQVYNIFAFFVVPVLKALLNVKPYQDAFVNIIYPGWLILRNLANIFFILALLVVGLRILFQQSAASTARGFILRLIVMALLVNFSLVIGQGIVAIADTAQSQFLPANSKVIEALGQKLMVEPIVSFRNAGGGDLAAVASNGANFGDLAKPIVLLILAVAAFFSFLAIAAFLAVRIVALMVLYMVSPIAYVGFVMDETKGYAKKWWNEFIKYAFVTPILIFFLNIAALVATATSSKTGNVFSIGDGIADNLVVGGLTIVSHFIVLLIIFAGMKFALSSGHAGAKTIVNYAQEGFKKAFELPGKGGKYLAQWGADSFADSDRMKGKTGWQRAIRAAVRPVEATKAFKKGYWDIPKEHMNKRFADSFGALTRIGEQYGEKKLLPAQMAYWKLTGKDSASLIKQAEDIGEKKDILTDEERKKKLDQIQNEFGIDSEEYRKAGGKKEMSTAAGVKYMNFMDKDIEAREQELADIDDEIKDATGRGAGTAEMDMLSKKRLDKVKELTDLQNDKATVQAEIDRAHAAGADANLASIETELKPYLNKEGFYRSIDELNKDDALRAKFKIDAYGSRPDTFTDGDKRAALKSYQDLLEKAAKRDWLDTPSMRAERALREEEQGKPWKDVDDRDALIKGFEDAVQQNNPDLAGYIAKKMAKAGLMDDLLHAMGKTNNLDSFREMMDSSFRKLGNSARANLAMQISHLAGENGNTALKYAIKVSGPNARNWNTNPEQQAAIRSGLLKKKFTDLKKNDIATEIPGSKGKFKANNGVIDNLNSYSHKEGLTQLRRNMNGDVAKFVLNLEDSHLIDKDVYKALQDATGKKKK